MQDDAADTLTPDPKRDYNLEVRQRAARYGTLRSAQRALSGSTRLLESPELEQRFRELRSELGTLAQRATQQVEIEDESLAHADSQLAQIEIELFAQLGQIPLNQLRATLPGIMARHPEEIEAVLDLALRAGDGQVNWEILDYVVTLLSTEETEGVRRVVKDPTQLTALMRRRCAQTAQAATDAHRHLAERFDDARAELIGTDSVQDVIDEIRQYKATVATHLLIPEVLRATVAYNVAVGNRLEALAEAARYLEDADPLEIMKDDDLEDELLSDGGQSAFGSRAVMAIEAALRARFAGEASAGIAAEIAAKPARRSFKVFEESAFRDAEQDAIKAVVRVTIAVGLLLRSVGEMGDRLGELGIDGPTIQRAWVPEVDARINQAVQDCIGSQRFQDARRLAEVRTKFLHTTQDGQSGWDLEQEPAGAAYADPMAEEIAERVRRRQVAAKAPKPPQPVRAVAAAESVVEPTWKKAVKATLAVVLLASAVGLHFFTKERGNVEILTAAQLAALSPYIESGYRDGQGAGPLFIGTVNDKWAAIPADKRAKAGKKIGEAMGDEGIKEVMLFDGRRRLQIHYKGGRLTFPSTSRGKQ